MTLYKFYDDVVDTSNRLVAGVQVKVYSDTTLTTLASVFRDDGTAIDQTSTDPTLNPLITNSRGQYQANVETPGNYNLTFFKAGMQIADPLLNVPLGGTPGAKGDPGANSTAIGLFTDISGLAIASGTDLIQTTGYSSTGVGPALYVYDAAVDSAYVTSNPRTSAITTNGRGFRLSANQPVNVQMFGALPDDATYTGTDSLAAFQAAFDWSYALKIGGGFTLAGPPIYVPFGGYYISDTLVADHCFIFEGVGQGIAGGAATKLRFPTNKCGVKWTDNAAGFIMQGFFLTGTTKSSVNLNYSMIWAQTKGTIRNCFISVATGAGIYIDGTATNANSWRIDNVRVQNVAHSAIYVSGTDANGGLATGIDAGACDRYCLEDASFLGNTWIFNNLDGGTLGPYACTNANAGSVFIGYTEGGWPAPNLGAHAVGLGPQFAGATGGALISASATDGGGLDSSSGFYTLQTDLQRSTTQKMRFLYGCGGPNFGGQGFGKVINANYSLDGTDYFSTFVANMFSYGTYIGSILNTGAGQILLQGISNIGMYNYGLTNPFPSSVGIQQLVIGDETHGRLHDTGTAAPITGEYAQGSVRYNSGATPGGRLGWVCTTAGAVATANWAASTAYNKGDLALNDSGKTYVCITVGTSASSGGPTGTGSNITDGTAHWKYLAAFVFSEFGDIKLQSSATYDPASLADGVGATTTVTVTGAVLGDFAMASFSLDLQGITLTAWVSAADTVSVRFQNESGGTLDLASGTLRARVIKQ